MVCLSEWMIESELANYWVSESMSEDCHPELVDTR